VAPYASIVVFLFTATPSTAIHTLSLHDALPISLGGSGRNRPRRVSRRTCGSDDDGFYVAPRARWRRRRGRINRAPNRGNQFGSRSEEHTSELQSRFDLVCRLLLEKKNK